MSLPQGCVVRGFREALAPAAVRAYRHYGLLLVEDFLDAAQVRALTAACTAAVHQRGDRVFPGIDPQHQSGATTALNAQLSPMQRPAPPGPLASSASLGFGDVPLPPEMEREVAAVERERRLDTQVCKVHLTLKNQRAVDRVYKQLSRARTRYNRLKRVRQYVTAEEEASGDMSDERIREVQGRYTFEDFQQSFQHYRDSGLLERELRHDHHINDAMAFMQDWPRMWCHVWPTAPDLQALAASVAGAVGRRVGEAAGHLAGEVVVRLYTDNITQATPLSNASPLTFTGAGVNFVHPHALSAQLGLAGPPREGLATTVVLPGSHHVVRRISLDGKELDRFQVDGVFDVGSMVRGVPEVSHLAAVELPPLAPGAALFLNNFVISGTLANLLGTGRDAAGSVASTPPTSPSSAAACYGMSLLPDRCVFDGRRNSWASRDSHGPLHAYERGQLLTDDAVFPVLHRALDIE